MKEQGQEFELDVLRTESVDPAKSEEGVWCPFPEFGPGYAVKIARWGNDAFMTLMQRRTHRKQTQIQRGRMPWEEQQKLMNETVAETIIRDWRGFTKDGQAVAYTPKRGVALLANVPSFREDVEAYAKDEARYRLEDIEEMVGNSEPPSTGNASGAASEKP